ncbi:hypothetical protein Dcar01_01284 [Deinococcus carri]|uniref:Uncharacterized protein n=1 Tax=Deinococcus carri TaxID=1211323 RepID=A0ABP9W7P1_9DEIO
MSDDKPHPPAERSPQGGQKDTDDLSGVKDVQRPGMKEKSEQVEQLPDAVVSDRPDASR